MLTIDHTKVSGNQNDFPLLVSLIDDALKDIGHGGQVGKADGTDVLFTSSDGTTKLAHELEQYDGNTGQLVAWVKVPNLSTGTDTVLYLYYGNSSAADQQSAAGVWDSNFKGVWHLKESSGSSYADSTVSGAAGTTTSAPSPAAGKVGGSQDFTTGGNHINLGNPSALNITGTQITVSAWINPRSIQTGANNRILSRKNSLGYDLLIGNEGISNTLEFYVNDNWHYSYPNVVAFNAWQHVAVSYDGSMVSFYLNGTLVNSQAESAVIADSGENVILGATPLLTQTFDGKLDEIRISNVARTADWIATEYNNQSSPATFLAQGGTQSVTESVSTPNPPAGIAAGTVGTSYTYTATGGESTLGHSVQYQFGWGDGSSSGWLEAGANTASHTWSAPGTYNVLVRARCSTDTAVTSATSTGLSVSVGLSGANWDNHAWTYVRTITIDHAKVAAGAALDNFPILISLTDSTLKSAEYGGLVAKSDGTDIAFASADGTTKLAHELEKYGPSTGKLAAWVKVPNLSSTTDTVLYMYYGNSSATDQRDATNVWDSAYRGVWHLKETGGTTYADSTANNSTGTSTSAPSPLAGQVGGGQDFSAAGNHIDLGAPAGLNITGTQLTISAWINPRSFGGESYGRILDKKDSNGYALLLDNDGTQINTLVFFANDSGTSANNNSIVLNNPQHVVAAYDGSIVRFYVNGVPAGTAAETTSISTSWANATIGNRADLARTFDGMLDEVRVSTVARSAQWIQTEYANQSSPSDFLTLGASQSNSGETISAPTMPAVVGTCSGTAYSLCTFSAAGAASNVGHSVQYQFRWGDGTSSDWLSGPAVTASHLWPTAGTYTVTVQARCASDTGILSANSPGLSQAIQSPQAPVVSSVSPASGAAGTQVTITGTGFGATQGAGRAWLGTAYATVVSWSDTQIVAAMAPNSSSGAARVFQSGVWSNDATFDVTALSISSISPTTGVPGTE